MKKILNILLCLAITAGMASCGMSGNKKEEGNLSSKEKKEVGKILDETSDKVEIKGDNVIHTTEPSWGITNITTYIFSEGKCVCIKTEEILRNEEMAQNTFKTLKAGLGSSIKNLEIKGNTVSYERSGKTVETIYSNYTPQSLRDKIQKEIDDTK